eukprot:241927-Pelagomonas_calceolata.AAC.1
MDSINHVVLRCPNPTMSGMHTNRHHVGRSFCVKALRKGRGYKFQKTSHEPFRTGFFLMVLAPLLGTRAALM